MFGHRQIQDFEVEIHHDSSSDQTNYLRDKLLPILKTTGIRSWKILPGLVPQNSEFIADNNGTICVKELYDKRLFNDGAFGTSKPIIIFLLCACHLVGLQLMPDEITRNWSIFDDKEYVKSFYACADKHTDRTVVVLLNDVPDELSTDMKTKLNKVKCLGDYDLKLTKKLIKAIETRAWIPFFMNRGLHFRDAQRSIRSHGCPNIQTANRYEDGQRNDEMDDDDDDHHSHHQYKGYTDINDTTISSGYMTHTNSSDRKGNAGDECFSSPDYQQEETLSDISSLASSEGESTPLKTLFQPLSNPIQESMEVGLTVSPSTQDMSTITEHEILVNMLSMLQTQVEEPLAQF